MKAFLSGVAEVSFRIGSKFTGQVRNISVEGYGVVNGPENKVFFVLGVFPGDFGEFEIIKVKGHYGYAKIVNITDFGLTHQPSPCPHQGLSEGKCGGCPWMTIDYPTQLRLKREMLLHSLLRFQLVSEAEIETRVPPLKPSPKVFGFRNRAQFKTDGKQLGYVSRFSRTIAPIDDCIILNEALRARLRDIISKLPNSSWTPGPGYPWCFIEIDDQMDEVGEIVINTRRPFCQGNTDQNEFMKSWVLEKTKLWTKGPILELFAGAGNFTEVLAKNMQAEQKLVATEVSSRALLHLQKRWNDQLEVVAADLYKPSDWKLIKQKIAFPKYLFLDPPRDGFAKINMFVRQFGQPEQIIYIACNLERFIHDSGLLKKLGYQLEEVQGVDQFPHTPHLELLAKFCKK